MSAAKTSAHLQLANAHMSAVTDRAASLDINCTADASELFRVFSDLRCNAPLGGGTIATASYAPLDTRNLSASETHVTVTEVQAQAILDLGKTFSTRIDADLTASGTINGSMPIGLRVPHVYKANPNASPVLPLTGTGLRLVSAKRQFDIACDDATLENESGSDDPIDHRGIVYVLTMSPDLGGTAPATLEATTDADGYDLHLRGSVVPSKLAALAAALPPFGDGLGEFVSSKEDAPKYVDLVSHRRWSAPGDDPAPRVWSAATPSKPASKTATRRRR